MDICLKVIWSAFKFVITLFTNQRRGRQESKHSCIKEEKWQAHQAARCDLPFWCPCCSLCQSGCTKWMQQMCFQIWIMCPWLAVQVLVSVSSFLPARQSHRGLQCAAGSAVWPWWSLACISYPTHTWSTKLNLAQNWVHIECWSLS